MINVYPNDVFGGERGMREHTSEKQTIIMLNVWIGAYCVKRGNRRAQTRQRREKWGKITKKTAKSQRQYIVRDDE